MELVYLWVEDYKNIKKQGFNFSPRFNCQYDEEKNELTIGENDDYIENFFGENINVTAIVGENGSAKSNILKALFQNNDNPSAYDKLWYILEYDNKLNIYFIDHKRINEKRDIEKNFTHNIETLKKEATLQKELNFSIVYFSNILHYLPVHNDKQNKSFYNISTSYLIDRYSGYNNYKSKIIEQTIIMLKDSEIKLDFEIPQSLNIVTQGSDSSDDEPDIMKKLLKEEDGSDFQSRVKKNVIYNFLFNYLDENELNQQIDTNNEKTIQEFYEEIKSTIPLQNELDDFLDLLDNPDFLMASVKIQDIDDNFIEKLKKFNSIQALSLGVLDVFHFNWKPELSSGQENYLFQFASFYSILKNARNLKKDIVILIDEGETTMHPNWQREYVKYYIDFLEKNFKDENFHLILTSHSPFIISDLPKENVIFLEKNEKTGNCKNVTKETHIKTFGANIHTLLSHGFFMKDGLMGEFAKQKINEIIDFFNKKNEIYTNDKENLLKIINSIGEPFLKEKLLSMYNEKYPKSKEEKIAELEAEIQRLKTHG